MTLSYDLPQRPDIPILNIPQSSAGRLWATEKFVDTYNNGQPSRVAQVVFVSNTDEAMYIPRQFMPSLYDIMGHNRPIYGQTELHLMANSLSCMLLNSLSDKNPPEVNRLFHRLLDEYLAADPNDSINIIDVAAGLIFSVTHKDNWTGDNFKFETPAWVETFSKEHDALIDRCIANLRAQITGKKHSKKMDRCFHGLGHMARTEAKMDNKHFKHQYNFMLGCGERYLSDLLGEDNPETLKEKVIDQYDVIVEARHKKSCSIIENCARNKYTEDYSLDRANEDLNKDLEIKYYKKHATEVKNELWRCPIENEFNHNVACIPLKGLTGVIQQYKFSAPVHSLRNYQFNPNFIATAGRLLMYAHNYPMPIQH